MENENGYGCRCFYCQHSKHGHGQQDCQKCHTKGKVSCATCDGQGQIRCYIQLSVTWKVRNHRRTRLRLADSATNRIIRGIS